MKDRLSNRPVKLASILALLFVGHCPAHSGVLTAPISWVAEKFAGNETVEIATKEAGELAWRKSEELVVECLESKELASLARSQGPKVAEASVAVAGKTGLSPEVVAQEVSRYARIYRVAGFDKDAIAFGLKHGDAGRFFVSRPELFASLKNSGVLEKGSDKIVEESWKLVRGTGGSWQQLRAYLTESGLNNGVERDFCETLFVNRARAGGIPGMLLGTELISGHIGQGRQGIDFLLPEEGGRLRVIEFGTGAKPSRIGEMSFEHIRSQLADFMEKASSDMKVNLRGQGVDPRLFDAARLHNPHFPIERFVQREIYATKANPSLLSKLGSDVRFIELP